MVLDTTLFILVGRMECGFNIMMVYTSLFQKTKLLSCLLVTLLLCSACAIGMGSKEYSYTFDDLYSEEDVMFELDGISLGSEFSALDNMFQLTWEEVSRQYVVSNKVTFMDYDSVLRFRSYDGLVESIILFIEPQNGETISQIYENLAVQGENTFGKTYDYEEEGFTKRHYAWTAYVNHGIYHPGDELPDRTKTGLKSSMFIHISDEQNVVVVCIGCGLA